MDIKLQEKNELTNKFSHVGIEKSLSRRNSDPRRAYEAPQDSPFGGLLLSESQSCKVVIKGNEVPALPPRHSGKGGWNGKPI